jgi:hypothetical protein
LSARYGAVQREDARFGKRLAVFRERSGRSPAYLLPDGRKRSVRMNSDALMREVVGFIQLACALTLGMAGGWAVHQMGVVMGWSGF